MSYTAVAKIQNHIELQVLKNMTHEEINELLKDQHEKITKLRKGIEAVRSLIDESEGVAGLHLNGDIASWDELEQGGRFEQWLSDFNEAESV